MTRKKMAPMPASANAPPKWRQDEMFRLEEYPSPVGHQTYQPSRTPAQLSPDEVKTVRRCARLKQDLDGVARALGLSSADCRAVATLKARAEVPSDFESPGQRSAREGQRWANEERERKAQAKKETDDQAHARGGRTS